MSTAIRILLLLVALIESVHLRAVDPPVATQVSEETIETTTIQLPRAKTIDTFVPIADLLNVIAGIQDQLPPLRVKVASFPVSADSSIKSQAFQETSTDATIQIEASTFVSISAADTTTLTTPLVFEATTTLSPEVNTFAPVTGPTVTAATLIESPVVIPASPQDVQNAIPVELTSQAIPVEVAAPQPITTPPGSPASQINIAESIVPLGTGRLFA